MAKGNKLYSSGKIVKMECRIIRKYKTNVKQMKKKFGKEKLKGKIQWNILM